MFKVIIPCSVYINSIKAYYKHLTSVYTLAICMPLSNIEHYLSYHLRMVLPRVLSKKSSHRVAYIFSLLSAIAAGFISLISLYTYPWEVKLHYSSWQLNTIASMTNLGMYLTPPILGMIADTHGPITLSFLSIIGFIPSYAYVGHVFNNPTEQFSNATFTWTVVSFTLIGISTSALYFSALLTCTKLYPKTKLLSISLPTTSYGLSSLIGSQILQMDWFWVSHREYLDLGKVFNGFALLYIIIGFIAWVSTGTVSLITHREEAEKAQEGIDETSSLLGDVDFDTPPSSSSMSTITATPKAKNSNSVFKDPVLYILAISMMLSLGVLEMFVINMGSLSSVLLNNPMHHFKNIAVVTSEILSIYAIASTIARLFTGVVIDYMIKRKISLKWVLLPILVLSLSAQIIVLFLTKEYLLTVSPVKLIIVGIMFGISYGALFTIYPTIVLMIWGESSFGTAYGSLMVAPAIGSAFTCMKYAHVYDKRCYPGSESSCISPVYQAGAVQVTVAVLLTIFIFKRYRSNV